MNDGEKPAPRQSLLVVTFKTNEDGSRTHLTTTEKYDDADAHADADKIARANIGKSIKVDVYRRVASYEAEVKVTMKRDGE